MNTTIPPETVMILAALLFVLGIAGVIIRKNIIFMLLSVEIMLNSAGLAFIIAGAKWAQPDGQVMFIFIWLQVLPFQHHTRELLFVRFLVKREFQWVKKICVQD